MKKIFLIIFLLLLAYEAYPQVRLSTMDSVTSFQEPDLFWLNRRASYPSGAYQNKKVSWSYLKSQMIDYIDGLANTWALKQTFSSGATFSAGANGTVTFSDSVVNTGVSNFNRIYPTTASTSQIGTATTPYQTMWAKFYRISNTEGNDSVTISYDDSTLTIDKTIQASELKGLSTISYQDLVYSVPTVTDSIDTVSYANVVLFSMPGADMTNLEKLVMNDIPTGSVHIVYFKIHDAGAPYNTVTLQDRDGTNSSDGNLELSGDFTLTVDDVIQLMYVEADDVWYEISEMDN